MIVTCPACGRALALADRNGRHVASEAHYPRRDAKGEVVCTPPARPGREGPGADARRSVRPALALR